MSHGPFTLGGDNTVRIDFSKLEAPDRLYDADTTDVVRGRGFISLQFGKLEFDDEQRLASRLEIKMSPETFVRHYWENSVEFFETLGSLLAKWPDDPLLTPLDGRHLKSQKTHAEWANFAVLARSGGHGTIDFYYLPPFGLSQVSRGRGLQSLKVVGVVRIMLTVHQMYHFHQQAGRVIEEVRRYLPSEGVING